MYGTQYIFFCRGYWMVIFLCWYWLVYSQADLGETDWDSRRENGISTCKWRKVVICGNRIYDDSSSKIASDDKMLYHHLIIWLSTCTKINRRRSALWETGLWYEGKLLFLFLFFFTSVLYIIFTNMTFQINCTQCERGVYLGINNLSASF